MSTNITVKTRFLVNGKAYAAVEEIPAEVRQAYERALSAMNGGKHDGHLHVSGISAKSRTIPSTVVFNGREYARADQMPPNIRELYDGLMATLDAEGTPAAAGSAVAASQAQGQGVESRLVAQVSAMPTGAVRPESTTSRLLIAGVLLAALLLGSFLFGR